MTWLELHRNVMFGKLHSIGKSIRSYHQKQTFDGNFMTFMELHETHVFELPASPQIVLEVGVQCTK